MTLYGITLLLLQVVWTHTLVKCWSFPTLNGHDGHEELSFDFFEPIITLFNLNETAIKRFLKLHTCLVEH